MSITDKYKFAVSIANSKTQEAFGIFGPYEPGSAAHEFWLSVFDKEFI